MLIKRWHKTRKCNVWDIRLIDEKGKKRLFTTGHTSKKVAERYEQKLKDEIAERKMFPDKFLERRLFKDFVQDYLKNHASKTRSFKFYSIICNKLVGKFGEMHLDEITRYQIEAYQSERFQQVGVYMVNRELAILKGIFTKAIDWGFAIKNPVKGIKLAREKARVRFLTAEEISKLVEACGKERKAPYLRSVVILALFTGLRKMELLSLKREHVHLERDILEVDEGKGGYRRFVPLHPTAKIEIAKLMLQGKSEYVIHDKNGEPFKDVKKSFNSAVRRAGLHDVHFHDLRRTFGTLGAIAAHIDEKAMQKLLGHASIQTTMKHYVMSTEEHEKEAIERLGELLDSYMDTSKKEATRTVA